MTGFARQNGAFHFEKTDFSWFWEIKPLITKQRILSLESQTGWIILCLWLAKILLAKILLAAAFLFVWI